MIHENEIAPDFTLPDADGRPVSLSSFRGKNVVLFFYPADDTPVCTKEACSLRDGASLLTEKNTVIVGISPDDPASHKRFQAKYNLPYTLLSDPEKKVLTAWGAWGEKSLYGHKVIGVIRQSFVIGPDGVVKKHIKRVVTANAAHQVLPYL
jgi:thioredoxin-dependent peroxiredoxin